MFAQVPHGLQRIGARHSHAPHRHDGAYAALVLKGGYEEAGSRGRFHPRAGEILFHAAFESHRDRFDAAGAEILNLPLPLTAASGMALARSEDFEAIVRLARRDPVAAADRLLATAQPAASTCADWPDQLVCDLWRDPRLKLRDWSVRHTLSPETLSRGVRRLYGLTPAGLRGEIRARKAWTALMQTRAPLAQIADEAGFADQSHMTRGVVKLTGHPPGYWRR